MGASAKSLMAARVPRRVLRTSFLRTRAEAVLPSLPVQVQRHEYRDRADVLPLAGPSPSSRVHGRGSTIVGPYIYRPSGWESIAHRTSHTVHGTLHRAGAWGAGSGFQLPWPLPVLPRWTSGTLVIRRWFGPSMEGRMEGGTTG